MSKQADIEAELSSSLAKVAELAKRVAELEGAQEQSSSFGEDLRTVGKFVNRGIQDGNRIAELESVLSDVLGAVPGDDDDFASFFDNFTDELEQRARRVLKGE